VPRIGGPSPLRCEWSGLPASAKLRANLWCLCILPFLVLLPCFVCLCTNIACSSIVRVTRIGETRAVRSSTGAGAHRMRARQVTRRDARATKFRRPACPDLSSIWQQRARGWRREPHPSSRSISTSLDSARFSILPFTLQPGFLPSFSHRNFQSRKSVPPTPTYRWRPACIHDQILDAYPWCEKSRRRLTS
jgi:hypothetical protein